MRLFWILSLFPLVGCDGSGDDSGDTKDTSDTGDSGTSADDPYKDLPAGCITVDGAGDYPDIDTAVSLAAAGGTISICAGEFTAGATVDKALTIVGAGADQTFVTAATNMAAFDVVAADVMISAMSLTSERSAITMDGATGVTIAGVTFDAPQNWGIEASDTTFTVSGSTFNGPVFGGISASGGSASVSQCTFSEAERYGVFGTDAELSVIGSSFDIVYSSGDTGVNDGVAIYASGGSVRSEANVMTTPALAGILADDASVEATGDVVTDTTYGVIGIGPTVTIDGVTVTNALISGLFLIADESVTVSGGNITTDPAASYSLTYDEFWTYASKGQYIGGGILAAGPTVSLSSTEISGWNNFGLVVLPTSDAVALTVDGVHITGVSRMGAYLSGVEGTYTNSSITGTLEPELSSPCEHPTDGLRLDISFGMFLAGSNLAFSNMSFADNAGWGLSNYQSQASFDASSISNHACSGVLDFQGALTATATTFSGAWSNGNIWEYEGALNVSGSTFTDFAATYTSTSTVAGKTVETIYEGYGFGVYAYNTSAITMTGNTFDGGDTALYFYEAGGEITGNTFTNTTEGAISAYSSSTGTTEVQLNENTFDNFGGFAAAVTYATLYAADNIVGTQGNTRYAYTEYIDGVLSTEYSYEYGTYLFQTAYGTIEIDGLDVTSAAEDILYVSDGTATMSDVQVDAGTGLVNGYWYSSAPDLEINNANIDVATSYGAYLYNYSGNTESGFLEASDVTIGASDYSGVYISGAWDATFDSLVITGSGSYAVLASSVTSLALYDSVLESSLTDGLYASGGSLLVEGSTITGAAGDGMELYSLTATVDANSITTNGGYGMLCSDVTFTSCTENDLSGNTLGEQSGCDACAAVVTPE